MTTHSHTTTVKCPFGSFREVHVPDDWPVGATVEVRYTPSDPVRNEPSSTPQVSGLADQASTSGSMPAPDHPVSATRCPLPILLRDETATCGSDLYVTTEDSFHVDDEGVTSSAWKVECSNGHVLVVPDDDGNEHVVPLDKKLALDAVAALTSEETR